MGRTTRSSPSTRGFRPTNNSPSMRDVSVEWAQLAHRKSQKPAKWTENPFARRRDFSYGKRRPRAPPVRHSATGAPGQGSRPKRAWAGLGTAASAALIPAATEWLTPRRTRAITALARSGKPTSMSQVEDGTIAGANGSAACRQAADPLSPRIAVSPPISGGILIVQSPGWGLKIPDS
jgi:hypothetical protein